MWHSAASRKKSKTHFTAKYAKDAKEINGHNQNPFLLQKSQRNTKENKLTAEAAGSAEKTQRRIDLKLNLTPTCLPNPSSLNS
jgi:hypothetical protein